ncbi:hypothetical protein B0A50_07174 [Salinomyces thailandicus]|uniref:Uncharacterized protein n=1 Tax=Salinomyces thailandicus TaxID=706561 RepID=A0A4U0TMH4_9PEZI|nr:hypothetical protein B0A50_07174 [Salinomyces thailandica]
MYLDNILIYLDNEEEYIEYVRIKLGRKGAEIAPAEETRANGDIEPNALTIASSSRYYEDAA